MGAGASEIAPVIKPQLSLGQSPKKIEMMACSSNSVMILTPTKNVEIRHFDGTTIIKQMNLQPKCCCSTRAGGWVIGFTCGHLSEFDSALNLTVSYRAPGSHRAHEGSVIQVSENNDDGKCHLMSLGSDNTLNLWSKSGNHLHFFQSKYQLTSVCSSPFFAFLADDHCQIHTINVEKLTHSTFTLPSSVKSVVPLGEGFAGLVILENSSICVISATEIVVTFPFLNNPNAAKILPLVVEDRTGLITYAVMDKNRKLTLRALEKVTAEMGEVNSVYAASETHIVTVKGGEIMVYLSDDLETASMQVLPDMELPRRRISKFLMRI